ncbi:MAG: cadherin-like domain-containing protein, partial [Planctomycetales bacterium]|nr:cadherin-like domain-containing protein [Planctomycetales bacterium]
MKKSLRYSPLRRFQRCRSPQLEQLESRRLLALTAADDVYSVAAQRDLLIGENETSKLVGLEQLESIPTQLDVGQLAYSARYETLFIRSSDGKRVEAVDSNSHDVVSSLSAKGTIRDLDLTPDGRYLYVLDAGTNRQSWVHRYDLAEGNWRERYFTSYSTSIEAVDGNRLLLESYATSSISVYQFDEDASLQELDRLRREPGNIDFVYDSRSGLILQGKVGSYTPSIAVAQLAGDSLVAVERTGPFESAELYGGTSVLATNGRFFYYGRLQVDVTHVVGNRVIFDEPILAATDSVAFGKRAYYDVGTGTKLGDYETSVALIGVGDTGDDLFVYNSSEHSLNHFQIHATGVGVLANDVNSSRTGSVITIGEQPSHGEIISWDNEGRFRYRPDREYFGGDHFSYTITNRLGESSNATVTIQVESPFTTNRSPVADGFTFTAATAIPVRVDSARGYQSAGLAAADWQVMPNAATKVVYSDPYDILLVRQSFHRIAVIDGVTGSELSALRANTEF